ncbi:MAG: ABC transporter permease [Candidatus Ranarchaeia archaeon]
MMQDPSQLLNPLILLEIARSAIRYSTPLVLAGTGEAIGRRTGNINLGLEGIMAIGAFMAFWFTDITGSLLIGILAAVIIGIFFSLIHGLLSISLKENQVVSGLALTLVGVGLASFLYLAIYGVTQESPTIDALRAMPIPFLSDIPVIGPLLFNQIPLTYIGMILAVIASLMIFYTHMGLQFTACGENPEAAETAGISVSRLQYVGQIITGALTGLGGAFLSTTLGLFREYMVAGRGWITIALVTFSKSNPILVLLVAALFGAGEAVQLRLQAFGVGIPWQLLLTIPYLLTMFALVIYGIRSKRQGRD